MDSVSKCYKSNIFSSDFQAYLQAKIIKPLHLQINKTTTTFLNLEKCKDDSEMDERFLVRHGRVSVLRII